MKHMIRDVQTTFHPMMKSAPTICRPIWRPLPATAPPGLVRPKAAQPFLVAQRPREKMLIGRMIEGPGRERTSANASHNGADEMRVEDVQGIIDFAHELRSSKNVH